MTRAIPRSAAVGSSILSILALIAGCATDTVLRVPVATSGDKMAWILRLEDERRLTETPAPADDVDGTRSAAAEVPGTRPDLLLLVADPDVQIRRRAALAIGRIGLSAGLPALVAALGDAEPEVRQMAAFALGLIGDGSATDALLAALGDPAPVVQGRAAEALGLLGRVESATAIGELLTRLMRTTQVTMVAADEMSYPLDSEIEAFRLAILALARLKRFEPLAGAILAENQQPLVRWWPVAYALSEVADPGGVPALVTFIRSGGVGAILAARGLGAIGNAEAVGELRSMLDQSATSAGVRLAIVEALVARPDPDARTALSELLRRSDSTPELRLEAVRALARLGTLDVVEDVLDLMAHPWPPLRIAALEAIASLDTQLFTTVLSGLDRDPQWSVRAALAQTLGRLDSAVGLPRLIQMLEDDDQRVVPSVLTSLARLRAPEIEGVLRRHLESSDPVVRMAAARGLGDLRVPDAEPWLTQAYERGLSDSDHGARAAALTALAEYATPAAIETLRRGLEDKNWAVRRQTLTLLADVGDSSVDEMTGRPAPTDRSPDSYGVATLVRPIVSPHAYIETEKGTLQIELAVLDAPLTVDNFITLARQRYFDGLPLHRVVSQSLLQGGDRRGDGEGGPGYTIRDELNQRPFVRGTIGMSRDWPDSGGSQFFLTRLPMPSLDGRYTAFGTVVSGFEVLDTLRAWDRIERVRIWDGSTAP